MKRKVKIYSITGVGISDDGLTQKCLPQNCLPVGNLRVGICEIHRRQSFDFPIKMLVIPDAALLSRKQI